MIGPITATTIGGAALCGALAATHIHWCFNTRNPYLGRAICRLPHAGNQVALTFDDGPHPSATPQILDLLESAKVPATFFLIGERVAEFPDIARTIVQRGHEIGNHSFTHPHHGIWRSKQYWTTELRRTAEAIHDATARAPTIFRPPLGFRSLRQQAAARALSYTTIGWSCRTRDGVETDAQQVIERATLRLTPGAIVLMHDGVNPRYRRDPAVTIKALPAILEAINARNLRAVTISAALSDQTS